MDRLADVAQLFQITSAKSKLADNLQLRKII